MSELGNIREFAIKAAIVSVAAIFPIWFALTIIETRLPELRDFAASKVSSRYVLAKIEWELEMQAKPDAEFSPEQKQKMLANIKILSDRWRPFIQEAIAVASHDAKEPAKQ